MSQLETVERKFGPEPMSRREEIQWPLRKQKLFGLGTEKAPGAVTPRLAPRARALAGNMKVPSCQGCQGTLSEGQEYVFQGIFSVKCVWHILKLAESLPQISSLELPHLSDQDKRPFFMVFIVLASS